MEQVTAREWLERREPPAPPRLFERMHAALEGSTHTAARLDAIFGEAALVCLRAALDKGDTRAAALDLLAADALFSYACEAAAEVGPEAIERFARDFGAARLADLVPRQS
jgi:hypothetical protein